MTAQQIKQYPAGYHKIFTSTKDNESKLNYYAAPICWNLLPHQCSGTIMMYDKDVIFAIDCCSSIYEYFQIEAILGEHGVVVISRTGSTPEQFIFQSDLLTKLKV